MVKLLTVKEASKECGVSTYFLRDWIKQGKCPGVYSGKKFLINVERLEEIIREETSSARA